MSSFDDSSISLGQFSGQVRLFPLPNLVVFPHVVQPLHIFEPRYVDLLTEALETDRLIAMVLLEPGWERDYGGRPAISPVACLCKIISHQPADDGRHNVLLQGVRRAAIRRELPMSQAFRRAEVDLLDDFYPSTTAAKRPQLQRTLVDRARTLMPDNSAIQRQLDELLASQISLGMLTDIFAYTLGLSLTVKQRLLAEWNVDRRAHQMIDHFTRLLDKTGDRPDRSPYPPPFSLN
nr:LON peptidase substrate-binding domain-containing protein [Pirellula staleyi]